MTQNITHAITVLVTQFFLGTYVMLLIDFRAPKRKWRFIWMASVIFVVCSNIAVILTLGYWEFYVRFGVLTMTLPYILITMWCSRYKGARILFNISTILFIGCIGDTNAAVIGALFPTVLFLPVLIRAASFLLLYFFIHKFKDAYLNMLQLLNRGWAVLCAVPITTFLTLVYITNRLMPLTNLCIAVVMYGFLIVCACTYYLIYLFFQKVQQESEMQSNQSLMAVQIAALKSRIETTDATEQAIRLERHDLRHRMQTLAELVEKGKLREALNYIDSAQHRLEDLSPKRWCQPPVLDAVFSSYFKQAQQHDIEVDAVLSFPAPLPVDEAELSVVFANALENAIHANLSVPATERKLRCLVIGQPRLMFEILNPCSEKVHFDESGLPVSAKNGHGFGTRSISVFCKKYEALCQYELMDGWFTVRVIL